MSDKPKIIKVEVECVDTYVENRLTQIYDGKGKDLQEGFCVHGLTYRWTCDDCNEHFGVDE